MHLKKSRFTARTREPRRENGYTVIIPAAGIGSRMKGLGPKCLFRLSDKQTVLSRQIDLINNLIQPDEIIVVGGFEIEEVFEAVSRKARLIFNESFETTNVVKSIYLGLLATLTPNVIIIYGDLVFNDVAIRNLKNVDNITTVVDYSNNMSGEEIGLILEGNQVVNFSYASELKWGQILSLPAHTVNAFRQLIKNKNFENAYLFEVLNFLIENEIPISLSSSKNTEIFDIDTLEDLAKAKEKFCV